MSLSSTSPMHQRPRCFMDISIDDISIGRIVVSLFSDISPKWTENFRCLCTGERGISKISSKPLTYKNSTFHRVIKGFMCQGGDFFSGNGSGGESIYGNLFDDEASGLALKHDRPYLLSAANRGPNTNGSQFFITTKPAGHLDGKHVVFGEVISGQAIVDAIENTSTDSNERPYTNVVISHCGELVRKSGRTTHSDGPTDKQQRRRHRRSYSTSSSDSASSSSSSSSSTESSCSSSSSYDRRKDIRTPRSSKKVSSRVSPQKNNNKHSHATVIKSRLSRSRSRSVSPGKRFLYRYRHARDATDRNRKQIDIPEHEKYDGVNFVDEITGRRYRGRGNMRYRSPPPNDKNHVNDDIRGRFEHDSFRRKRASRYNDQKYNISRSRSPRRRS